MDTTIQELLHALRHSRIALTFYREWMQEHADEEYTFGIDAEAVARAAIKKAEDVASPA